MRNAAFAAALLFAASAVCAAQMPSGMQMSGQTTGEMGMNNNKPTTPSHQLSVSAGAKSQTFSPADMQAMPQQTVKVHNAHNNQDETYTGVPVSELLSRFGYGPEPATAQRLYHTYVRAEGTDKYWILFSASELEPAIHNVEAIVALTLNGQPLAADGEFKLVTTAEKKPSRWVHNLASLTIVTVQ